jgi:ATP-dependent DNA helicase PIF1
MTHRKAYYVNSGSPWTELMDSELRKDFTDSLNIIELGDKYKRTPGGISARLKALDLISNTQKVAGYTEYKASELYNEILEGGSGYKKKPAFYAVHSSINSGVYDSWAEATTYIKGVPGVKHKKFPDSESAHEWLKTHDVVIPQVKLPSSTSRLFAGVHSYVKKSEEPVEEEALQPQPPPPLKDSLNTEQLDALNKILDGQSIFLTGPGGSGKSYLLEALQQEFKRLGKSLAITALTGCAALLLGPKAKTLHSWASIGLGKDSIDKTINNIIIRKKKANWVNTDCLVIDEVSMMTPQLLEMLDVIGKRLRNRPDLPMGGLQVVLVGDFYQLPPIYHGKCYFAFQSSLWNEIISATVCLKQIYRQSDEIFQKILGEARVGELSEESVQTLKTRMNVSWKKQSIRPTLLFTRNEDVDSINRRYYDKLTSDEVVYRVGEVGGNKTLDQYFNKPKGGEKKQMQEKQTNDMPYDPIVCLKVGAQVMLTVNDPEKRLVNGSRGVVTGFELGEPRVQFVGRNTSTTIKRHTWKTEDTSGGPEQIPLRLAYALTIHKAQGASLDSALIDIGPSTFEYGQAYVALSRVRSLEALFVHDFDPKAFKVHPAVKAFYDTLA